MPDSSKSKDLQSKKSVFEKQKEEAEAKRLKEAAETAAVFADFVESLDADPAAAQSSSYNSNYKPPAARKHFALARSFKSGPGSLGLPPLRKKLGEPPINKLKSEDSNVTKPFQAEDDEDDDDDTKIDQDDRAASKPTLQLSSIPPGTSVPVIKALIPSNVSVDSVKMLYQNPDQPNLNRKSITAIVTLVQDTPASDIDVVVNTLQSRYLGFGYYLSISRHLSSTVHGSSSVNALTTSLADSQPFGAKPIFTGTSHTLNRAPPPSQLGNLGSYHPPPPPPPNQHSNSRASHAGVPLQVPVKSPSDIKQLKLIHKTLESVLTYGPEFEAVLMSRPHVQKEEKWAWIWDSRSIGGVWYRWRLWEILSGNHQHISGRPQSVFDVGPQWRAPEKKLDFEFITQFQDFVGHDDYNSSDEEDSDDEKGDDDDDEAACYLNPLQRAKLTHLLARLPTTTAYLRRGDVARITAFGIRHSGQGVEEIAHTLINNVEHPFSLSSANPDHPSQTSLDEGKEEDVSPAKLIALFVISDLLSSSSTSGVRHAWKYRQVFENLLISRQVFVHLGNLEKQLKWGRLRAEKWRRAVTQLLELWESWCVFSNETQDKITRSFIDAAEDKSNKPPIGTETNESKLTSSIGVEKKKKKNAWKSVDTSEAMPPSRDESEAGENLLGWNGGPTELGTDLLEDNLDGEPMVDSSDEESSFSPVKQSGNTAVVALDTEVTNGGLQSGPRRKRPRAVDMFEYNSDRD